MATATLSEAVAVTAMVPETLAPEAGEAIETVGGVVSPVAGLLGEPMSPAQAALSMANGRTSSHSLRVIVFVSRVSICKVLTVAGSLWL
jgi:hypothetical protein